MAEHRFKVGQTILLQNSLKNRAAAAGTYEVIGYRPEDDGEPSYRIKSELERHERIVRESELK
ncbi:MAG TPA: hypothetical protein VII91_04020 [Bauldia sp.]|jgi:hypothetical protein